jgi:hypothetical protein
LQETVVFIRKSTVPETRGAGVRRRNDAGRMQESNLAVKVRSKVDVVSSNGI